jgi:hypothetical protein
MHTKPRILLLAPWSTALGGWPGCGAVATRVGPIWTLLERFAIHEMYSSPATPAACTPSPIYCYWHHRAQLQVVGRAVVQWQQGSGQYGPYSRDRHPTRPSTKCIAAQPPSPHAHQAPNIATGILKHSSRWLAGLCCNGNKGRAYMDLLERHTHPRNV